MNNNLPHYQSHHQQQHQSEQTTSIPSTETLLILVTAFIGGALFSSFCHKFLFKNKDNTSVSLSSSLAVEKKDDTNQKEEKPKDDVVSKKEEDDEELLTDLENLSTDDDDEDEEGTGDEEEEEEDYERKKMVLVVRTDLKMGVGKVAAQCSHATLGVYRRVVRRHKMRRSEKTGRDVNWLMDWSESGCAKIALRVNTLDEMNKIREAVDQLGLPSYLVIDAGKTQIARNSATVLAVGPAPESLVNSCTGHLKLL